MKNKYIISSFPKRFHSKVGAKYFQQAFAKLEIDILVSYTNI